MSIYAGCEGIKDRASAKVYIGAYVKVAEMKSRLKDLIYTLQSPDSDKSGQVTRDFRELDYKLQL